MFIAVPRAALHISQNMLVDFCAAESTLPPSSLWAKWTPCCIDIIFICLKECLHCFCCRERAPSLTFMGRSGLHIILTLFSKSVSKSVIIVCAAGSTLPPSSSWTKWTQSAQPAWRAAAAAVSLVRWLLLLFRGWLSLTGGQPCFAGGWRRWLAAGTGCLPLCGQLGCRGRVPLAGVGCGRLVGWMEPRGFLQALLAKEAAALL